MNWPSNGVSSRDSWIVDAYADDGTFIYGSSLLGEEINAREKALRLVGRDDTAVARYAPVLHGGRVGRWREVSK